MAYVQIDPVACAEVAELFLSEVTFALLVNEWGRNVRRDEKIRDAVYAILNTLLASGAPVYLARRVHGRTFFVVLAENERSRISPRMFQETMTGHDDSEWICFDRNELFQAMPQLREEYPEPRISGDPWFRVMKHLDNLDFKKIFPEVVRPSGDNSESVMLGKGQYEDMAFAWESDEHTNKRIAELETALAAKDAELEQARAEMSALREENAALNEELKRARQEKGQGDAPEWYGLIAVVEQCRKEGKKPQETAAELKKAGASLAVIGGLLHPNGGISDWRQYGKNLLEGGTKYLPW